MADRVLVLRADEALVLFELLHRWEDEGRDLQLLPGEQTALWALSAALERVAEEPFAPLYAERVQQARQQLRERDDTLGKSSFADNAHYVR
ncbi:hypothetical protein [Microbacterium sp. 2MCAF23]|uniref:hypothetical protein n=1 Tax=Microbacterium sp. 2MCAF23 TaxID=3232985 RepID=UPI003F9D2637